MPETIWSEERPTEPGIYWFFGYRSRIRTEERQPEMWMVRVRMGRNCVFYTFDFDAGGRVCEGRFLYEEEGADGVWTPAVVPNPPRHEEEEIPPQSPPLSVGIVLSDGLVEHRDAQGQLHRLDGPAIERANGDKEWYQKGLLHHLDGPAVEWANGSKEWYQNGRLHRLDGPAVEWANGTKMWYVNGLRHRLDGPAIERANGDKEWWVNGLLHRLDGPAREWADGAKWWYQNGLLHHLDGPAVEWANGSKEWYQNGRLHLHDGPAVEWAYVSK